jgi:methyl-accepting chemotaxis protein
VKRVSDIMGEIASASAEQSTGIEQVNVAVAQMDEVTQQNAALVEQATAAAQSMADQAESLRATVSIFRVDAPSQAEPVPVKQHVRVPPKQAKRRLEPVQPSVAAARTGSGEWATF